MLNHSRVYNIKECQLAEMLDDLKRIRIWTLCAGWRVGNTLYLNDSFSENGAQEYAVLRVTSNPGEPLVADQFESFTISWMTDEEIEENISDSWNADLSTGDYGELVKSFSTTIHVQEDHDTLAYCALCA